MSNGLFAFPILDERFFAASVSKTFEMQNLTFCVTKYYVYVYDTYNDTWCLYGESYWFLESLLLYIVPVSIWREKIQSSVMKLKRASV